MAAVATSLVAISTAVIALQAFRVSQETLQVNTRQQTSERFVKATEQLGNDKPDVRLGGIFALEQLARDSPSDHPAVFDVLTAFAEAESRYRSRTAVHRAEAEPGPWEDPLERKHGPSLG